MSKIIFITGGARSGKSAFAEKLALGFPAPLCYLATAQALDAEMDDRISKHRQRRGDVWSTLEEPLLLSETLSALGNKCNAVLVDCVTLWLTNMLFKYEDSGDRIEDLVLGEVRQLAGLLPSLSTPVILVSNELGMGIVPENKLGRIFRDIAGQANQLIAAAADEAWLVASGIPIRLK